MNFFARHKKIFIALGFLILVLVIGYFLWRIFFKTTLTPPTATSTPGQINGLPTAGIGSSTGSGTGEPGNLPGGYSTSTVPTTGAPAPGTPDAIAGGGLTKTKSLNNSPSLDPTLSSDGQVQYYDQIDGRFYKVDKNGKLTLMSDKVFHNVDNVVWAPDKNRAVIEYPDGSKILYNFQTKKQVTLPSYWKDFSFSPTSDKLVSKSMGLDEENRFLIVSSDDGSKTTALEALGQQDKTVYPSWSPNNQIVAMYTEGVDFNRQEVYFVGLNDENFKSTIIEGRGFESQWSTSGDRLLYSVYNTSTQLNPKLWIVDATSDTIGQDRKSIDLQTWASKCTFASNSEVYCAVPENLEQGAGLFPELADKTKDNLYKIDLDTGTKKLIAVPDDAYNISQIMVPAGQDSLYFTDKQTGLIYTVKLK